MDRDLAALKLLPANRYNNPAPAWVSSYNHAITHDSTWEAMHDLEKLIRTRIRSSIRSRSTKDPNFFQWSFESEWSAEFSEELAKACAFLTQNSADFNIFLEELRQVVARIDRPPPTKHSMAIERMLYDHKLFSEALESFDRAVELNPSDAQSHFQKGNTLWSLVRRSEARDCYSAALAAAEAEAARWSALLPQVHVNLGIAMEAEGLLINAGEHYRKAAILCPSRHRAMKHLGSALLGVGDYGPGEKALEAAVSFKPDYADAHCDLGLVPHALGDEERPVAAFQRAIDVKPDHLDALYNLGGLFIAAGRYRRASEMYGRVLAAQPEHWRTQLNSALVLLGASEVEAKNALQEVFKLTKRIEFYDALLHLKQVQEWRKEAGAAANWMVVDARKKKAGQKEEQLLENKFPML